MNNFSLEDLERMIAERAAGGDPASYTAKLVGRGLPKCTQKLGEEAVETVIAALSGDRTEITKEAADLLYHLLVVLMVTGVPLADVLAELESRTVRTGLEEKAARKPV
ncbi:phosphoribosyl-ATP diphosphatase [Methylobrevis albus]|uniref:Phosphoribosyl-ATP pyrophosphatase n=1 Tax=Methylobrevis albus TaxID=2793297 RepID=A0A931MXB7_9HYPH|nr:phosphoribosyl-ATP diphosphatase [Methylobrevis albus]MBH0238778.1 phosphoribosyl-ATP diphosphatase [Methylobrevis albus]